MQQITKVFTTKFQNVIRFFQCKIPSQHNRRFDLWQNRFYRSTRWYSPSCSPSYILSCSQCRHKTIGKKVHICRKLHFADILLRLLLWLEDKKVLVDSLSKFLTFSPCRCSSKLAAVTKLAKISKKIVATNFISIVRNSHFNWRFCANLSILILKEVSNFWIKLQ